MLINKHPVFKKYKCSVSTTQTGFDNLILVRIDEEISEADRETLKAFGWSWYPNWNCWGS